MNTELLAGLAAFAFVTSITPGPNNLMLMASGANFGFRRSVPHMLGISIGFVFLAVVVGIGLATVFERYPATHTALKVFSVAYLLWLAWKIANAAPPRAAEMSGQSASGQAASGRPFTFLQAAAFQWVNPKAWAMALTAVTVYTESRSIGEVVLVACLFGLINLPSVSSWTLLGQAMRRLLRKPGRLRQFNVGMALLLVLSLYPVLFA